MIQERTKSCFLSMYERDLGLGDPDIRDQEPLLFIGRKKYTMDSFQIAGSRFRDSSSGKKAPAVLVRPFRNHGRR